jgi:4-hydroxy-tetrahydrodipicolinate synthase
MRTLLKDRFMPSKSPATVDSITGYVTAVPTPFAGDAIDEPGFAAFCHWQIEQGIAALVVNGTTGEAPTLSDAEQAQTIALAREVSGGRVPIIAGVGSNDTAHAVALAKRAERAGANGLLAVTPYYNRPSQEGLFRHFQAIHDASGLPILLYDVPSRTGVTIAVHTVERLAKLPRIVGLKDATGNPDRVLRFRRYLGEGFRLFSGDDATALEFIELGGNGCISVLSNVVPDECVKLFAAWQRSDHEYARNIASSLAPLVGALFGESNPVPLKFALSLMGRMRADVRLPLCEPSGTTRAALAEVLIRMGLISRLGHVRAL